MKSLFRKRYALRWGISLLLLTLVLAYLLWPLTSEKYHIEYDQKKIAYKQNFLTLSPANYQAPKSKPNIIYILADDLGKTDISLYGSPHVQTPHMDSIGYQGAICTEGYVTSPICSPSRAGILTGRYQQRFGYELQPQSRYPHNLLEYYVFKYFIDTGHWVLTDNTTFPRQEDIDKQGLPPSEISLGALLKKSGYHTASIGKWHLGHQADFQPLNRGFDYYFGFYEAFTLYADTTDPEIVNCYIDEFADRYMWSRGREGTCAIYQNQKVVEEDQYLTFKLAQEACDYMESHQEEPFFLYLPFSAPHTPLQAPKAYYDQFSHVKDKNKRVYYAMIKALDDAVGQIMQKLKALGLEENTLIMFASDNGGATYTLATDNAPLKGGKFSNFEGGINVPMMLKWKGNIPEGTVFEHPVNVLDLFATAIAASGSQLPEDRTYDGVNLLPYLNGEKKQAPHQALYWRSDYNRAIRQGDWKMILNDWQKTTLLYDMSKDKEEQENVAEQHPQVIIELKKQLENWEKGLGQPLWPSIMHYRFDIGEEDYFFAL